MTIGIRPNLKTLYDEDFLAWTEEVYRLLRSKQWDELDLEHLLEEVDTLGKSQQRSLQIAIRLILAHLLKWQYQSGMRSRSWQITITRERLNIEEALEESPSLRCFLADAGWLETIYQRSRREAIVETGLDEEVFPIACPFTVVEVLDLAFYPNP
jgi:hypothetical protein